jgi:hypothetical protein
MYSRIAGFMVSLPFSRNPTADANLSQRALQSLAIFIIAVTGLVHCVANIAKMQITFINPLTELGGMGLAKNVLVINGACNEEAFVWQRGIGIPDWTNTFATIWHYESTRIFLGINACRVGISLGEVSFKKIISFLVCEAGFNVCVQGGGEPCILESYFKRNRVMGSVLRFWIYQNSQCPYPCSLLSFQRVLALFERPVRCGRCAQVGSRLIDILGIQFEPLEASNNRVTENNGNSRRFNRVFKMFVVPFVCGFSFYSIYCGIRNMKLVGDWRGSFFWYPGVCGFLYVRSY